MKGPLMKTKYFKILINSLLKGREATEVTLKSPAVHSN